MNEQQKATLIRIFDSQNLPEGERNFWLSRLEGAPEEVRANIISLFEAYPQEIMWLRDIQEKKERALKHNDTQAWQEVLQQEEEQLGKLAGQPSQTLTT